MIKLAPKALHIALCLAFSVTAILPANATQITSGGAVEDFPLSDVAFLIDRSPASPEPTQKIRKATLPSTPVSTAYTAPRSDSAYDRLKPDISRLMNRPPRTLKGESSLGCIAVAIYHEARNQSPHGQLAVASVILQRAAVPGRWGDDACEVVIPVQFSFMTSEYGFDPILEQNAWVAAVHLAAKSLVEGPLPELKNADHYHTVDVDPSWSRKMQMVGRIGHHIFFRDPDSAL
jgi:hypothetical protein